MVRKITKKKSQKGSIIPILLLVVVAVIIVISLFNSNFSKNTLDESKENEGIQINNSEVNPTPTPFLFEEITIPYLRERNYQSSLGELRQISENSSYTSYLTSYDPDGLKVNALLTIPQGTQPAGGWPAVVFVHGYIPPALYQTTSNYVSYVDYLAKNGFVVFKIDLRGHGNSEGEPGGGYYSSDYVIDTLNAYQAVRSADFVNAEKVGLWGHSMAGNVIFRSLVAEKNIPAVVIWAGAVYTYDDMNKYGVDDNSYRPPAEDSEIRKKREKLRQVYGNYDPKSEFWQMVVPTNYLDGVTGAVQLNHAVNDTVVNIGYSRDLMKILDGTAIVHQLNEYQSGGHNLNDTAFNQAMENTVAFYQQYLGN